MDGCGRISQQDIKMPFHSPGSSQGPVAFSLSALGVISLSLGQLDRENTALCFKNLKPRLAFLNVC